MTLAALWIGLGVGLIVGFLAFRLAQEQKL